MSVFIASIQSIKSINKHCNVTTLSVNWSLHDEDVSTWPGVGVNIEGVFKVQIKFRLFFFFCIY